MFPMELNRWNICVQGYNHGFVIKGQKWPVLLFLLIVWAPLYCVFIMNIVLDIYLLNR